MSIIHIKTDVNTSFHNEPESFQGLKKLDEYQLQELLEFLVQRNQENYLPLYLVCFIDLIGQKDKLGNVQQTVENGSIFRAIQKQQEILRTIDKFRTFFVDHINKLRESKQEILELFPLLDNTQRLEYLYPVHSEIFSDSIMIYTQVARADNLLLTNFEMILITCVHAMLEFFSEGIFFRGGISLGRGMRILTGNLYAYPVYEACELEESKAKSFRIVVPAQRLHEIDFDSIIQNSVYNNFRILKKDENDPSIYVLDTFGEASKTLLEKYSPGYFEQKCLKILKIADQKIQEFQNNPQIQQKYIELKNTVQARSQ